MLQLCGKRMVHWFLILLILRSAIIKGIMKQPAVINNVNQLTSCLNKKHTKINLPKAKSTIPPATATPNPLKHPPGTQSKSCRICWCTEMFILSIDTEQ
jgi:hypothetical protein